MEFCIKLKGSKNMEFCIKLKGGKNMMAVYSQVFKVTVLEQN